MKQQRDKLKQYQKRIELSLEKDRELAKKCLAGGRKEYETTNNPSHDSCSTNRIKITIIFLRFNRSVALECYCAKRNTKRTY